MWLAAHQSVLTVSEPFKWLLSREHWLSAKQKEGLNKAENDWFLKWASFENFLRFSLLTILLRILHLGLDVKQCIHERKPVILFPRCRPYNLVLLFRGTCLSLCLVFVSTSHQLGEPSLKKQSVFFFVTCFWSSDLYSTAPFPPGFRWYICMWSWL